MNTATPNLTVFDALLAALQKAADYNRDDVVRPAAVLWPDEKREWERLAPRFRASLPHFFTLGTYDPATRTGPAIWLRCVLAGKIPDVSVAAGVVPILYLPDISRATMRATEDCPPPLKPLAELQYRGVFWSQVSAKDWTISAFLQTEKGGLNLAVAKDQATATSIRRAVEQLADVPVADLQAKSSAGELNGNYFDTLISDDPVDDLLSWLADPSGVRGRWDAGRWETLCSRCIADYGFDPARDGELVGAEKLGTQTKAAWKTAWKRFESAPARYAGLTELLRRAKPTPKAGLLFGDVDESWPQDNDAEEDALRKELLDLSSEPPAKARQSLLSLEEKHGSRREWVWAKLNRSPLAGAMRHLAILAEVTTTALTGATTADMVRVYTEVGWKADAAVLDALAAVARPADQDAVKAAVAHVYTPWLRDAAELFQQRVKESPLSGREVPRLDPVAAGTCVLFADGLRYDVGQKLLALLSGRVGTLQVRHQFVALPSVTPTAKPAVSPVAAKIKGTLAGEEFRPCVAHDDKDLTPDRFRKLLADDGVQYLAANEVGDPTGKAWTEFGNLDTTGHNEGSGMARRIPELLTTLVLRIESLLAAGWQEVRVVTDHGWLLVPNGLPKSELPKYLTATRWRRCAVVKPTATVDQLPVFGWFWADDVRIACPPGIDCFMAGEEYNHGGLSLQECVVPQFTIQAGKTTSISAKIESVKWSRLRCRVQIVGDFSGCKVDLRDKPVDPTTSLTGAKSVGSDGAVSLPVADDSREGTATTVVLLDSVGNVVAKAAVTVGE
ncbi:MAG: BREX-1 system phosphatase PglZ type B [Planctomycetes bacterium]|nr:BREX-1 system phosphatase PglZ type B [Planctomycetota bacterium]